MKQKLIDSINYRLMTELVAQNPVSCMKTLDIPICVDIATSVIFLYTRSKGTQKKPALMTEVICAIGHTIRNKFKMKRNTATAARMGAFLLYSYELVGLVKVVLGQGHSGHGTYLIELLNDDALSDLFHKIPTNATEKLPSETQYADWTTAFHPTGQKLVKTENNAVLQMLTPETHPYVFDVVNKAQRNGWMINKEIYDIHLWALRNKTDAFSEIWEQHNPEAKATKLREARTIGEIASRFLGKTFYHLYYLDFRGRKYPATAYLHEQGSDLAKGLLLRSDKKRIGSSGFFWLCVSIATNWAGECGRDDGAKSDKIPLKDRHRWVLDNEEIFLSYAISPKVNQGWMQADSPWQFLAACYELKKFREWQASHVNDYFDPAHIERLLTDIEIDPYGYESHLECYIDGSTNGAQHLAALTRDEVSAPYVNLVPQDLPGDLYSYVAEHVWEQLGKVVEAIPKKKLSKLENIIDTLMDLKEQIANAPPKSDRRKELVEQILEFKKEHDEDIGEAASVFWYRIVDKKHRRKVVKRNVMTLPYGGSPYGLGQQQIDDAKKHGISQLLGMEHRWGSFMGRMVYEDCKLSLARPMRLLSIFEQAGKAKEDIAKQYEDDLKLFERGKLPIKPIMPDSSKVFLSWTVPVTNFPVVQHYTEGTVKKTWVQYGPPLVKNISTGKYENTLQLMLCYIEITRPSRRKQSQGASPNAIHSLDAAHLMIAVHDADFPITTIHDSYGALLGDMPKLYELIRSSFVKLYADNPLQIIMKQINGDISGIEFGTLDIKSILESEYAFC